MVTGRILAVFLALASVSVTLVSQNLTWRLLVRPTALCLSFNSLDFSASCSSRREEMCHWHVDESPLRAPRRKLLVQLTVTLPTRQRMNAPRKFISVSFNAICPEEIATFPAS